MKDIFQNLPRWALILVLGVTLPVATYAITDHVREDTRQSAEIMDIQMMLHDMAKIIEYNYKETEANTVTVKEIETTQRRLEVIMARIEARLDKDASS